MNLKSNNETEPSDVTIGHVQSQLVTSSPPHMAAAMSHYLPFITPTTSFPTTTLGMATTMRLDLLEEKRSIALSIEEEEEPEKRVLRAVAESPVVVLSRSGCCMCHVVRRLLATVGVHPIVIELEVAVECLPGVVEAAVALPVVFVGGELVGGLESLMGLHLSGGLVPRLREVGALWV